MQAGKLRHIVAIQSVSTTLNDYGESIETWADFMPGVNCQIIPSGAREYPRAAQLQAEATHAVKMRYRPGVTNTMRLIYGARTLNIVSAINEEERGIELLLVCKEVF